MAHVLAGFPQRLEGGLSPGGAQGEAWSLEAVLSSAELHTLPWLGHSLLGADVDTQNQFPKSQCAK